MGRRETFVEFRDRSNRFAGDQQLYGTDLLMKIKTIKTLKSLLSYTINESISWTTQENGRLQLKGFGAHSMRNGFFYKGLKTPIDIYDVHDGPDKYSFPYEIWTQFLDNL